MDHLADGILETKLTLPRHSPSAVTTTVCQNLEHRGRQVVFKQAVTFAEQRPSRIVVQTHNRGQRRDEKERLEPVRNVSCETDIGRYRRNAEIDRLHESDTAALDHRGQHKAIVVAQQGKDT
jgi:hypothetical protein